MSQIKLLHSGGNGVILSAPDSNPASDRTLKLPGNANSTVDTLNRAGNILQVIYVQKTDTFSSSSSSWVDITGLTADITMTSSSNKVFVICHVSGLNDATTGSGLAIDRGGSFVGLPQSGYGNRQNIMGGEFYEERQDSFRVQSFTFLDTPGSGTHTYKVRAMPKSQALYINRSAADGNSSDICRGTSDMTLMEVAA
tara:strand:+ start:105 stop:695 length:591 start_codon:yes stop_codon:yes gene_type:complete